MGSYTSFIRPGKETKNIVFPFDDYSEHLIIGFVYSRGIDFDTKLTSKLVYSLDELEHVVEPISNIEFFVQEKWRIAGDTAGSGNTANIGSISGTLQDFRFGNGPFRSEGEYLEYWRGYERTAKERSRTYATLSEFRQLRSRRDY